MPAGAVLACARKASNPAMIRAVMGLHARQVHGVSGAVGERNRVFACHRSGKAQPEDVVLVLPPITLSWGESNGSFAVGL